jgi:hypothetical protein
MATHAVRTLFNAAALKHAHHSRAAQAPLTWLHTPDASHSATMVPLVVQTVLLVQVLPRGVLPQALVQAAMGRVHWMSGSASRKGEPAHVSGTPAVDKHHNRHCICCRPLCHMLQQAV